MKSLEEEALEYAEYNILELNEYDEGGLLGASETTFADKIVDFTSNSKWVQAKQIKASLEPLYLMRNLRQNHGYFGGHDNGQVIDREIEKYEQQLKELIDEKS